MDDAINNVYKLADNCFLIMTAVEAECRRMLAQQAQHYSQHAEGLHAIGRVGLLMGTTCTRLGRLILHGVS